MRFRVSATPAAVSESRRRIACLGDIPEAALLDSKIVVTELLTNSILHAGLRHGDMIDVAVRREDDRIVIEVDDRDGLSGERGRHPVARRPGGMGLKVLDAICDGWHADSGRVVASLRI